MIELTEQQEQEMIEKAKAGDPEANYNMSLWALEQAMAEPDEERWNRLAAKCLVKAAEAGYAPAKAKMDELLAQTAAKQEDISQPAPAAPVQKSAQEKPSAPVQTSARNGAGETAAAVGAALSKAGKSVGAGFASLGGKIKALFAEADDADGFDTAGSAPSGKASASGASAGRQKDAAGLREKAASFFNLSQWDDAKWKRMQKICIIICVILAILITILVISGKKKRAAAEAESFAETDMVEVVTTPVPVITPEPAEAYPPEDIRTEIAEAGLDVFPDDSDYVTEAKTVVISTSGSALNLRRGPAATYIAVGSIPNNTTVSVYAYRNGWALVKYNDTWGWCSNEYLK